MSGKNQKLMDSVLHKAISKQTINEIKTLLTRAKNTTDPDSVAHLIDMAMEKLDGKQ